MISINTDIADIILQSALQDSTIGLNNAIEKMSTSYKVNRAKDNAANFSIIKDLSTKISSMLKVQQNTENGISLLQTAEGGLEEIQKLLERLRALTNQAANGTYDTKSRNALQQEADAIIKQIAQIRDSIEYNNMTLYEKKEEHEDTAVTRLAKSAKINGTVINDTSSSTFTAKYPVPSYSASESVQTLSDASISLYTSDTIEGAQDFGASATGTINIDGVTYTVTNKLGVAQTLSYKKDTTTGEVTFYGSSFIIKAQTNIAHNVVISGSKNSFYGGNLKDTITVVIGTENYVYGGKGDDNITIKSSNNYAYGQDGNDTLTVTAGSNSRLYGDADNDTINIKGGNWNYSWGGAGNDITNIYASGGSMYGDTGDDTFNIIGNLTSLTIDGGSGTNNVTGTVGSNTTMNVVNANTTPIAVASGETKNLTIDGKNYSIRANSSTNLIYSISNGVITFRTIGGSVAITGDANSSNNVKLASNNMTFYGGTKNDTITVSADDCYVYANNGTNNIIVNSNNSWIYGQKGNNTITINSSCNYVDVGTGDNNLTIKSGVNNNTIYGNSGGKNTLTGSFNTTNFVSGFGNADTENIGYEELSGNKTKTITIGDKQYTIKNRAGVKTTLLYTYNEVTGEVSFGGKQLTINAQKDASHNVSINGREIIFYGGDKDDIIVNNANGGQVHGEGGNDKITISGYTSGWSYTYGGDGDEEIIVNSTGARIFGEAGNDKITINASSSYEINGGTGDDTYYINANVTGLVDDGGNNIYYVNTGNSSISGSSGDDTFYVKGNNNTVLGGGGKDYFINDGNNNTIDGGTGNDNYYIENGSGTTSSNIEKDPNSGALSFTKFGEVKTITLNRKTYTVTNNLSGTNTLKFSLNKNTGVITFESSNLTIKAASNQAAIINIRGDNNSVYGSNLTDTITIEAGSGNTIYGLDGNDILTMESEKNSLIGGNGNDILHINAATDKLIDGGEGNDTLNINANSCTNVSTGNGNDTITISGNNNNIKAGNGDNIITINDDNNTVTANEGKNKFTITSSSNNITTGNGGNTIGVQGNNNTIKSGDGNDTFTIRGNSNNMTTSGGKNSSNIKGNSNTYQGGTSTDNIRLAGDSNKIYGGSGENDNLMISSGNNNTFDGQGGSRNTIINNGQNTTFTNTVDITPHPFELNIKVDIGSGKDKFISTSISFNLFDFSVDLMSQDGALESLDKIDEMMKTVQDQLLNIGATINRLQTVIEAQASKLENMISSRSTLQDADIATWSSNFIKSQILQQASSTLMSSSRNLKAQSVLGLLANL